MLRHLYWGGFCALGVLLAPIVAPGATKTWTSPLSGDFADPARWTGGVPGAADNANFNSAGTYTVTFNDIPNPVLNEGLLVSNGAVTFASGSGGPYTYHLTGDGTGDANVVGGSLTLGSGSDPLHLSVDDELFVYGGALFNVNAGSQVQADTLWLATVNGGGNGTVLVDIPGSSLSATVTHVGTTSNSGTLTFRNSSAGSLGALDLARDSAGTMGTLNVESNADVTVGEVGVASGEFALGTGTINIHGSGSTLTQTGSSAFTVGSDAAVGRVNIGTAFDGGTVSTGTGTLTINANGAVTIGEGGQYGHSRC